jgi:transcriptional regulator of arginine metabolism
LAYVEEEHARVAQSAGDPMIMLVLLTGFHAECTEISPLESQQRRPIRFFRLRTGRLAEAGDAAKTACDEEATSTMSVRDHKKRERRRLIESVLSEREVGTQREIVDILESMGCEATQTSVARDLVEMGVQKVRGTYGRSRYVLPRHEMRDPEQNMVGTLVDFCKYVDVGTGVTVVGTAVGAASTVGSVIDAMNHPDIVGTLAGYDTCVVFCRSQEKAEAMRDYFERLRNGGPGDRPTEAPRGL